MILLNDARLRTIIAVDDGDSFVDMSRGTELLVDGSRSEIGNRTEFFACVRKGVYERLLRAQGRLPSGLRFIIKEGFRPVSLQTKYHNEYLERVRDLHPELSTEQLISEVSKYVAPPDVAPHSTGGAVDIALAGPDGVAIDMGSNFNADPADSLNTTYFGAPNISAESRNHREILKRCMESEDFVNYPTEWWHWSHGDKYWALLKGRRESKYDSCDRPFFTGAPVPGDHPSPLTITRDFASPPSRVWQAWTDPKVMKRWFGSDPNGVVTEATVDLRVGGRFEVSFVNGDGSKYTCLGTYREVDLYRRLVFTWTWRNRPEAIELVTVRLEGGDHATRMVFTHADIDPQTTQGYEAGWNSTFDKLERALR